MTQPGFITLNHYDSFVTLAYVLYSSYGASRIFPKKLRAFQTKEIRIKALYRTVEDKEKHKKQRYNIYLKYSLQSNNNVCVIVKNKEMKAPISK